MSDYTHIKFEAEDTKANLDSLASSSSLVQGALYNATDQPHIYYAAATNLLERLGASGTPVLTNDQIAFGDSNNEITSSSSLTFDGTNLTAPNLTLDGGTTQISSGEINLLDGMISKTGIDTNFVTGTAGGDGAFGMWNADGDIVGSGLSPSDFAESSHTHSASEITSGTLADARISQTSVTQHEGALTITESQISDLNHTTDTQLSNEEVQDIVGGMLSGNTETLIAATYQDTDGTIDFVVDDDLNKYDNSTSGFISDYTVTQSDVTQHEGALSITESQISDLSHFGGALDDLSDVFNSTPSDGDVIIYDGVTDNRYENRALVEADISDFGSYATTGHTHTLSDITDSGTAASKGVTGADSDAVTGTAGTSGNVPEWNSDGDIVDSGKAASDIGSGGGSGVNKTETTLATGVNNIDMASGSLISVVSISSLSDNDNVTLNYQNVPSGTFLLTVHVTDSQSSGDSINFTITFDGSAATVMYAGAETRFSGTNFNEWSTGAGYIMTLHPWDTSSYLTDVVDTP